MHGWPQNHREFLPLIEEIGNRYRFIVPDLRGYAGSDKPIAGYEPKTIANRSGRRRSAGQSRQLIHEGEGCSR
jgi:pimeloyl-ACP methyl ester carboxylesterase